MKIVDRETFLSLPSVLFSKLNEHFIFESLAIKGSSLPFNDFQVQEVVDAALDNRVGVFESALKTGENVSVDLDCFGRDGLFDKDQIFAVWDKEDVALLIARLQELL